MSKGAKQLTTKQTDNRQLDNQANMYTDRNTDTVKSVEVKDVQKTKIDFMYFIREATKKSFFSGRAT